MSKELFLELVDKLPDQPELKKALIELFELLNEEGQQKLIASLQADLS